MSRTACVEWEEFNCCGNSDCMLGPLSVIFVCLFFCFVCLFVCLFVCFAGLKAISHCYQEQPGKKATVFTPFLPTTSHPRSPDLIVEVAHPSISAEFGATFLQTADFMVL